MNKFRFITISILVLALASATYAQSDATTPTSVTNEKFENSSSRSSLEKSSDNDVEKTGSAAQHETKSSSEYLSEARRSAVDKIFTKTSNPFGNATKADVSPEPQVVDEDKWQFQLTPYLWIAGISGRAGIGALVANVDAGLGDDNVSLNFGFMGTFEARKNRFILLTDLQFTNLAVDNATPGPLFTAATADFKTFIFDPEVGYRLFDDPEKGAFVDVLGGIRYWHLRTDLLFTPGLLPAVAATRSKQWVDAVGGIRGRAAVTKKVFLTGKVDLGGGGSDFTYQLFGGAGFLVGKRYALIAGYRYLSVDYNKDGFLFDVALHGPIMGFGIRF